MQWLHLRLVWEWLLLEEEMVRVERRGQYPSPLPRAHGMRDLVVERAVAVLETSS
jgi:hypothetical protein